MSFLRFLTLLAFTFALPLVAQEAKPASPLPEAAEPPAPTFSLECRMVTIPGKLVPAMVPELNDDSKAAAAVQKLQGMIEKGEATLTANITARGVLGERTVAESIQEVRYATEFQPPQLPDSTKELSVEVLKNWPHVGVTPTAFATRNVGQTIEIEVGRTSDPKVLHASYRVQHVRFEKMNKIDAGRLANGERLSIEQPHFSVMQDTSATTFELGQPRLIGVHRLPGPEGVFELFILTLRLAAAKAP